MQDLVATPVRPPAALPSGQNHGEQQDAAVVAVDLTTPVRSATTLPTGQNHGEQQSPVVVAVSTPVRFAAPPPDMLDENDSVLELGTTPAYPLAPLPGRNTDENQGPVANGVEKAKCATTVCDHRRGCDKLGEKAGM
jgi:hypothetical protein